MVAPKHEAWMKVRDLTCITSIRSVHLYVNNCDIRTWKANLGNLEYWMLEGVGHAPFWEAEEKVNGIVRSWCEKVIKERI